MNVLILLPKLPLVIVHFFVFALVLFISLFLVFHLFALSGTITLIMMLLGRSIFAKFGWRFAALVTPTSKNYHQKLFCDLNSCYLSTFSSFFVLQ